MSRDAFHAAPFRDKGHRVHQLGFFFDMEKRDFCPLCSLLTRAYRNGPAQHQTAFEGSRVFGSWSKIADDEDCTEAGLHFFLDGKHSDLKLPLDVRLMPKRNEVPAQGAGLPIKLTNSKLPFDLAREWLHRCETDHSCRSVPLSATSAGHLPMSFTVIDVKEQCLVQPSDECRFLALSYMWGSSNRFMSSVQKINDLKRPGALVSIWNLLAPPIKDAVILTKELHERYIWIDAVCIPQSGDDGAEIARDNISSMDSIYRHAVCTIIAADNDTPDGGMAGVSTRPRKTQQFIADLSPDVRVLARFSPQSLMLQSRYRSRGWTYVTISCVRSIGSCVVNSHRVAFLTLILQMLYWCPSIVC